LVATGLFELGEVVAAQVLDQDGQHLVAVVGQVGPLIAGHGGQAGGDGRGLAAVPGKDPVAVVGGHDHEGLEHADLADRGGELVEVAQVVAHVAGVVEQRARVEVDEGRGAGGFGHGGSFLVVC
jgi:hypothetical protein